MPPSEPTDAFSLIESLRWSTEDGYVLLSRHLERLAHSAAHFAFRYAREEVIAALDRQATTLAPPPVSTSPASSGSDAGSGAKVRLLLGRDGGISTEAGPIGPSTPVRVTLAATPVDPGDDFLYHKTTRRIVYERALASRGDADDVLLWNPAGKLTEASSSNIVVKVGQEFLTPPVSEGLLAGTFRAELLAQGVVRERVIGVDELLVATEIYLVNSVRGWRRATYIPRQNK
jgi:para-aminobenzoate synthetase/4-amino-4-deoxychorismate lyase